MNGRSKITVFLLVALLMGSLTYNIRQRQQMKNLAAVSNHDLIAMTVLPVVDILSRTNEAWSGDKSIELVRDATWRVFLMSAGDRAMFRGMGLIERNDTEAGIDVLIEAGKIKMHNQAAEATARTLVAPGR